MQAAYRGRDARLAVHEDDLKWVLNKKNILLLLKQFHETVRAKTLSIHVGVGDLIILHRGEMML